MDETSSYSVFSEIENDNDNEIMETQIENLLNNISTDSGNTLIDSGNTLNDSENTLNDSENALNDSENTLDGSENTLNGSENTLNDTENTLGDSGNTQGDSGNTLNVLNHIRVKNPGRVIVGSININSLPNKFDQLKFIITDSVDILIVLETKLDESFPTSQFLIDGFCKPYRLDRDRNGGGILIYVREGIPSKELSKFKLPSDIEGLYIEINLKKSKWLLFGSYHPPNQNDNYYFDSVSSSLDIYSENYDHILLAGDFNAEEKEVCLNNFLYKYNMKNIMKHPTCFKNPAKPTCIDLFLTNKPHNFQSTTAISNGLSDFHKMIVTVLKCSLPYVKPKEISYRDYKYFNQETFSNDLSIHLESSDVTDYSNFEKIFMSTLDKHAPIKRKLIRGNHAPYMTKSLRKSNNEKIFLSK